MTGDEHAAWLARQRAAGCTCPELHLNSITSTSTGATGVLNRSEHCPLHGLGTASWERYHEVASERLRAAWAEVHAARRAAADPTPDGADPGA